MLKVPDIEPRAIPPEVFDRILEEGRKLDSRIAGSERRQWMMKRRDAEAGRSTLHNPPGSVWWVAFLSCAYLSGLRWGEILGLQWRDLRFTANPTIRIRAEISKTERDQVVPMTANLFERLKAWMDKCPNIDDKALVFSHKCCSRTIHATWDRLQEWAGIKELYRFHDTRVSFCTNLVATGTEAATLMTLARHRSLATTMKYYRGRTDEADRRALDRMEAAINGNQQNAEIPR